MSLRVLEQLVSLVKQGIVKEEVANDVLVASRVIVTEKGRRGLYVGNALIQQGAGKAGVDPLSISNFEMPKEWHDHKQAEQAQRQAKPEPAPTSEITFSEAATVVVERNDDEE
jgi:hypothetical protein